MRLRINGEDKDVGEATTVAELVASLGLAGRRVAVEHNREILPATSWSAQRLAENDVLEIVHFVGGG
ncbi:MAG: sulfur carrier protein ThiS [Candidatus Binatia bacterium]